MQLLMNSEDQLIKHDYSKNYIREADETPFLNKILKINTICRVARIPLINAMDQSVNI